MDFDLRVQRDVAGGAAPVDLPVPGKRTLTEHLLPASLAAPDPAAARPSAARAAETSGPRPTLQMLFGAPRAPASDPADVHAAAERGIATPSSRLPYADHIQRAFGRHDVSGIQAHVGPGAAAAAHDIGARAYATGDHVVLAPGADLHTVAHEAAHVVQQRAGVHLKSGIGETGDAYEQHADAVADLVVRGSSAEAALDQFAPGPSSAAPQGAVQRAPVTTPYGVFNDERFAEVSEDGEPAGVEMYLSFTPTDPVEASAIGLSQVVRTQIADQTIPLDASKRRQQVPAGPAEAGYVIDRESQHRNPLYAAGPDPQPGGNATHLEGYGTPSPVRSMPPEERLEKNTTATHAGWGHHGSRVRQGQDWDVVRAELYDRPTQHAAASATTMFETTAMAIEGAQKGTYYGSVTWGLQTDGNGAITKVALAKGSDGVPTQKFMAAARQWNATTARGTLVSDADPTPVYNEHGDEIFVLPRGVELTQQSTGMGSDGTVYLVVAVAAAAAVHAGDTGMVKESDVKDRGDGAANVRLPLVDVKRTTGPTGLYAAADKQALVVQLPQDTRVRLVSTQGNVQQVSVVDGTHTGRTGWIDAGQIANEA